MSARDGPSIAVDCARKARAMIFTVHVNQNIIVDGEDLGPAPVEGVPDAESVVQALPHKYLVYGREVAPDTGYVQFKNPMAFRSIHKKLRPFCAWLQLANGSALQNREYCTKDGDVFESGVCPTDGGDDGRVSWDVVKSMAEAGLIELIDSKIQIQQVRNLERIEERAMFRKKLLCLHEHRNLWIVGAPGIGKSAFIWRLFREEDAYDKQLCKYWDNYKHEPLAFVQDVDAGHGKWILQMMKIWTDVYPFSNPRKFGAVRIRPAHIIVTSNSSPDDVFSMHDPVHVAAVKRRFVIVDLSECGRGLGAVAPGIDPDTLCRCPVHHPELFPNEAIRRVVTATQHWPLEFDSDDRVNCHYPEDHPIWAHHDAVPLNEIAGFEVARRLARPLDASQASQGVVGCDVPVGEGEEPVDDRLAVLLNVMEDDGL